MCCILVTVLPFFRMKRLFLFFGILIIPTAILAVEFKYILDDAEKFEEELRWQEQEQ